MDVTCRGNRLQTGNVQQLSRKRWWQQLQQTQTVKLHIVKIYCELYLEEPLGVLLVVHRVIEVFGSSTEEVAILSICQSPANCPVRSRTDEGVQHVLDKDVDSVLGPEAEILNNIEGFFIILCI